MLTIHHGDALAKLRAIRSSSVQCCVTSPPYWGLRDYGVEGQIGLEPTFEEFLDNLVAVFREVRRVLKRNGTCWINMGDCHVGGGLSGGTAVSRARGELVYRGAIGKGKVPVPTLCKAKDLLGQPWALAFALRAGFSTCDGCGTEKRTDLWPIHNGHRVCIDCLLAGRLEAKVAQTEKGWFLRRDIIWHKPNPMPESAKDRPTNSHEYLFLLSKSKSYFYDHEAIKERVTGNAHPRGDGVNPKASVKTPSNWDTGEGAHGTIHKRGRDAGRAARPKQNESFSGSVRDLVETRNKRTVWTVPTMGFKEAHFATYPPDLIKPCILAGTRPGDVVLDCFAGSGTTGMVALELGRKATLIEVSKRYLPLIHKRCDVTPGFRF